MLRRLLHGVFGASGMIARINQQRKGGVQGKVWLM
jgi:hypothetical protein